MYTTKKNLKVESKGTRFQVADFLVKIGTVSMSSGPYKGILVEVGGYITFTSKKYPYLRILDYTHC